MHIDPSSFEVQRRIMRRRGIAGLPVLLLFTVGSLAAFVTVGDSQRGDALYVWLLGAIFGSLPLVAYRLYGFRRKPMPDSRRREIASTYAIAQGPAPWLMWFTILAGYSLAYLALAPAGRAFLSGLCFGVCAAIVVPLLVPTLMAEADREMTVVHALAVGGQRTDDVS